MYYLLCRIKPDSREDLTETLCILRADTSGINTSFCFPTGHFSRDFHARKYNFTQACSAIREGYQRMRIHVRSCSRYKLIRHPYLRLSSGIFWGDENFLLIFIVLFFHYHLVPLDPPPLNRHCTVVCVHESFFLFAHSVHRLTSPTTSCQPALHL